MPKHIDIRAATRKALNGEGSVRVASDHYVKRLAHDEGYKLIPRDLLSPDPEQPRKHFATASLEELAASIKEKGILQTLTVRPDPDNAGRFLIVAGERRWRAAGLVGLDELPCIIRTHADHQEVALIENLQRENLTAIEEAEALFKLKTTKGYTDKQLAHVIGKSRQAVNDSIALNDLPEHIKAACRTSGTWSKSQLLQMLRAGSPQKLEAVWRSSQKGERPTVRELRKKTAKPKAGRPQHYRFEHKPSGKPFTVTVTFARRKASRVDLRTALKDALKHLP